MRFWLDTEFIERPGTIDLISIGIVDENDRQFYAESSEVDWSKANDWVLANVKPHLLGGDSEMPRSFIAERLLGWMAPESKPEVWAYYGSYDWVVTAWLFGTMMDLPKGYPMFIHDIKQWCDELGNPQLPKQEGTEHNALADARHNRVMFQFLEQVAKDRDASK